jgi:RES domain-containing protein
VSWRLEAARGIEISGRFWRMLAPRWAFDPLSGVDAVRAGGRWNEPGQAALFLSDDQATAIAEYQQDLPRPGTLTAYDVTAPRTLDLANPETRHAIGLDEATLCEPWKQVRDVKRQRPAGWDLSVAALASGWHGIRVPSVQAPGRN